MVQTGPTTSSRVAPCGLEISYDGDREEYHFDHDWNGNTSVGSAIVLALESITGTDVHDLDPLHDAVDPDALDDLFEPLPEGAPRHTGLVSFAYAGHVVTVNGSGRVEIRRL